MRKREMDGKRFAEQTKSQERKKNKENAIE